MQPVENNSAVSNGETTAFIVMLGKIISFVDLYGAAHNMARTAVTAAYEALSSLLAADRASLAITVADNGLMVDGRAVESKNPLVARLLERLVSLDICGFSLKQGMTAEEFSRLVGLLSAREPAPGAQSFAQTLADGSFDCVVASRTLLREVDEDEEVVKKTALTAPEHVGPAEYGEEDVREIIAFLKGNIGAGEQEALQDPDLAADNAAKLSELIMQSVAIRQRAGALDQGESITELVVGCLRRTFEGLSSGKAARTKTGRKRMDRAMVVLEKEVLDRLREFAGDAGDATDGATGVQAEIKRIREEINIDNLVSDYLRRRKAAEDSEKKLLRLMETRDPAWIEHVGLQDTLIEGGLDISDWRKLEVQSGAGTGAGRGGGDAGQTTVNMLALVLNELTQLMEQQSPGTQNAADEARVDKAVKTIEHEVDVAVLEAERKIDALAREMQAVHRDGRQDGADAEMRSRKNWALVSEIVQEICQPLTVINCTIDMFSAEQFGTIPERGREPLAVARECALRVRELALRLVDVCGVPPSLSPQRQAP